MFFPGSRYANWSPYTVTLAGRHGRAGDPRCRCPGRQLVLGYYRRAAGSGST